MTSNWKKYYIGDICKTISETYRGNSERVVLINTSDVLKGKVLNHSFVKNENLRGQFKKTFKVNDILFSEIRPANERYAFIDFENTQNYIASTKLMVIRADTSIVVPKYLYYILTSKNLLKRLQHLAETRSGTFPQITFNTELSLVEVLLPTLDVQKKIVKILSSLDDKKTLNERISRNLHNQALVLFEERFKDVCYGDHNVSEYILPHRGKNLLSKDAKNGNVPVVAGGLEPSCYHDKANTVAPVITISASGANAGYISLWNCNVWSSDSSYIDSTMTKNIYFWYCLLKKRQKEIFDSQTGSAQPHIYPQHIGAMQIGEIIENDVSRFNAFVKPLFEKKFQCEKQNETIQNIIDELLPKLMSGEIDVSKVKIEE